jgi:hypothetical protein
VCNIIISFFLCGGSVSVQSLDIAAVLRFSLLYSTLHLRVHEAPIKGHNIAELRQGHDLQVGGEVECGRPFQIQ